VPTTKLASFAPNCLCKLRETSAWLPLVKFVGIESIVVAYRARIAVQKKAAGNFCSRARKRASGCNILTRFLFNYRPVTASLRSLITLSQQVSILNTRRARLQKKGGKRGKNGNVALCRQRAILIPDCSSRSLARTFVRIHSRGRERRSFFAPADFRRFLLVNDSR